MTELLPNNAQKNKVHWPSVWQFALSMFAALWAAGIAVGLLAGGISKWMSGDINSAQPLLMLFAILGLVGITLTLSGGLALLRLINLPRTTYPRWLRRLSSPWIALALTPLVILLGDRIAGFSDFRWSGLPFLHLMAVALPVWWFLRLGLGKLPKDSPQRQWGLLSAGLILAPVLIGVLEIFFLVTVVLLGILLVLQNPVWQADAERLYRLLALSPTQQSILHVFRPWLEKPWVGYSLWAFMAVIVPLIEEAIKPIGVWLLLRRNITSAEGFVAGAISGAGYALYESLSVGILPASWTAVVLARIGTGFLHTATAALMGWALAQAWKKRSYIQLGITYLTAVALHSIWNTLAIATGAAALFKDQFSWLNSLAAIAPLGLGLLSIGLLVWMLRSSAALLASLHQQDAV